MLVYEDTNTVGDDQVASTRCPNVRAIQASAAGGPDVLELVDLPDPTPGPDEVLVRVGAAGINFVDT